MGKTSFALSIAKNIAVDNNEPIAFFSLEMNNVQLVNRLISNTCEISGSKILSGQLSDEEWKRFDVKVRNLTGTPIYIDDTPGPVSYTHLRGWKPTPLRDFLFLVFQNLHIGHLFLRFQISH